MALEILTQKGPFNADELEKLHEQWRAAIAKNRYFKCFPKLNGSLNSTKVDDISKAYLKAFGVLVEWKKNFNLKEFENNIRFKSAPHSKILKSVKEKLADDCDFFMPAVLHEITQFLIKTKMDLLDFDVPGDWLATEIAEHTQDSPLNIDEIKTGLKRLSSNHSGARDACKAVLTYLEAYEKELDDARADDISQEQQEELDPYFDPIKNTGKKTVLRPLWEDEGNLLELWTFMLRLTELIKMENNEVNDFTAVLALQPLAKVFLLNQKADSIRRNLPADEKKADILHAFRDEYKSYKAAAASIVDNT